MQKFVRGFTLIELLIVIAILAILATIVLIVINPVQMFAQARDSQRVNDAATLSHATALYLTTVTSPDLHGGQSSGACSTHYWASRSNGANNFTGSKSALLQGNSVTRAIDGTGWVPVPFSAISGGSPLSTLPIDPINDLTYYYTYACDNTKKQFEYHINLESERYKNGGDDDMESTDGGSNVDVYEVGNVPGLNF